MPAFYQLTPGNKHSVQQNLSVQQYDSGHWVANLTTIHEAMYQKIWGFIHSFSFSDAQ